MALRQRTGLVSASMVAACAAALLVISHAAVAAAQSTRTCTGQITGTVGSVVVPSGATCVAVNLTVKGDLTIQAGATFEALDGGGQCDPSTANALSVRGQITAASGATLLVASTALRVGGDIIAQDALELGVTRIPCTGSTGTVGGDISVDGTTSVGLSDLTISGSIFVRHSGAEGLELTSNVVRGTISVQNNKVVGASSPSIFAIDWNSARKGIVVIGNDATGAIVPPLVGANTISDGNLVCAGNVPALTNIDVDTVLTNTVTDGQKLGQCTGL